ncbi:MAG TPA: Ig-like domain-containing protein [Bacteroidales bacterium]|nr:Ig-like domain-containing protein [Bacteroidales bacterium]
MCKRCLPLLLIVLFVFSCKKESDTYSPQITITSPYENQVLMAGETVNVIANVCDDRKLEYVSVKILNDDFTAVTASQTRYPENNCTDINLDIQIDNILLPAGTYYILVSASDGANTTNEFRQICISQVNKKLKFILVLTQNNGTVTINKIDSLNNISQVKTVTTDYRGSAVSSDAQQFYMAGRYTGDVSVYNINDWQLQWDVPVIPNPPFPYFMTISVYNTRLYVSYREGRFEIYNETGSIIASRVVENGEYPLAFLPFDDYLITYEVSPDGLQKHLVVYYVPSMAIYKKIIVNYEILKMYPLSDDECVLFCNGVSQGVIRVLSLSSGDVTDKYIFSNGVFTDVTCIEPSKYLFLADDYIWYYSYDYKGHTPWADAQAPRCIVYDDTEGCYYFSENNSTVTKNRFLPNETINSFNFQDTIINILPVYNRD